MEEKFILVSLNEKKSKDIATVMGNETARKILEYLSEKEKVSPIELSKKLQIPLPTITHALKLLEKEGFILRADHVWSEKGRKVSLYTLTKKIILIVPKGYDWKEGLKKILPLFLVGAAVTIALKFYALSQQTSEYLEATKSADHELDVVFASDVFSLPQEAWAYTLFITFGLMLIVLIYDVWRKHR